MKLARLRGRKVCDRVVRHGRLWKGRHLMVRWLPGAPRTEDATHPILFAGTLASTKLDKSAVRRNRMRRRSREALRTVLRDEKMPLTLSAQLLLLPRSSSLNTPFPELQADIRAFLRTLHG